MVIDSLYYIIHQYNTITIFFALSIWVLLFHWCFQRMAHKFWNSCVCIPYCCICSCSHDWYRSLHQYVQITVVTKTCRQHHNLKRDLTFCILCSICIIIHLNPAFFFWISEYLCSPVNTANTWFSDFLILHPH